MRARKVATIAVVAWCVSAAALWVVLREPSGLYPRLPSALPAGLRAVLTTLLVANFAVLALMVFAAAVVGPIVGLSAMAAALATRIVDRRSTADSVSDDPADAGAGDQLNAGHATEENGLSP